MSGDPGPAGVGLGGEFAGHRIEAVLGRGGMGIVYRARNLALDRMRALKVLSPALSADARFRERFRRESRLAASIEHPNVIPVHQAGEEDGQLYLSMRLVEGLDLRALVSSEGPLDPSRGRDVIRQVAAGLDAAHAAGLLHRDVKPANVLVGAGADDGRVCLTDFGISRATGAGETITGTGELIGTADFVAPEQASGDPVDHRADLYALAAVVHFTLTGRPPFPRDNELATLFAHANAPRPRPTEVRPDLPPGLDELVARGMAVDPADRFASGAELADALDGALAGEAVAPAPPRAAAEAPTRPLAQPRRRRRAIAAATILSLAAAVAAAALILSADDDDRGNPNPVDAPEATASPAIDVGETPTGLSIGPARVWVAARGGDAVDGINLEDARPEFTVPVTSPKALAVGHDSIWAVSRETDALSRIDAIDEREPVAIPLSGCSPVDVAADADWIWVACAATQRVLRIDPATNSIAGDVRLGTEPRALAVGEGSVWVTKIDDASVSRIDPDEASLEGSSIEVGELPNDIAVGEGAVWVTSIDDGTVTRIDPDRDAVSGEPIEVGSRPRGIAAGLGYVWVTLGGEGEVVRIDPGAGALAGDPIPVGREPADVAVAPTAVWVANEADSTITRIDP